MIKRLLTRLNPFAAWRRRLAEDERFVAELHVTVRMDEQAYREFLDEITGPEVTEEENPFDAVQAWILRGGEDR